MATAVQIRRASSGRVGRVSWDCHFFEEKEVDWALMAGTGLEQEERERRQLV